MPATVSQIRNSLRDDTPDYFLQCNEGAGWFTFGFRIKDREEAIRQRDEWIRNGSAVRAIDQDGEVL